MSRQESRKRKREAENRDGNNTQNQGNLSQRRSVRRRLDFQDANPTKRTRSGREIKKPYNEEFFYEKLKPKRKSGGLGFRFLPEIDGDKDVIYCSIGVDPLNTQDLMRGQPNYLSPSKTEIVKGTENSPSELQTKTPRKRRFIRNVKIYMSKNRLTSHGAFYERKLETGEYNDGFYRKKYKTKTTTSDQPLTPPSSKFVEHNYLITKRSIQEAKKGPRISFRSAYNGHSASSVAEMNGQLGSFEYSHLIPHCQGGDKIPCKDKNKRTVGIPASREVNSTWMPFENSTTKVVREQGALKNEVRLEYQTDPNGEPIHLGKHEKRKWSNDEASITADIDHKSIPPPTTTFAKMATKIVGATFSQIKKVDDKECESQKKHIYPTM